MKPKILVISNYRSTVTVRPEAEIFIALAQKGWSIDVMTYGDSPYIKHFREAGVNVIEWHPEKKFDKQSIQKIRDHLRVGGHHILQLYNSKAYTNGIKAANGLDVKVVLYRGYQGNLQWYDPSLYTKYYHRRVDKIICNSIGVEEEYRKQLFSNARDKVVTINKGHRLEWYEDVKPADLSTFGVKKGSFVFTCVANTRPMKGVKYIMKALHHLPDGMDIFLLMVGRGLETIEYRKLADESTYGERVVFTGFQPNALEIDKASDVFLLASIYGESITKSVIEAMSLGTTPLITNIPGNKYLVEDGKSGYMIPSKNPQAIADAMVRAYQNKKETGRLGVMAQRRIEEKLNIKKTIAEMTEFYLDLIDTGGKVYKTKPGVL
ncbi:MAG: glycosyltransferase family 4 protein [Flavobacteriales bacterium]|nr:glycosyltransferase family 4 protein [Flavobacteriales bacterium]